MNGLGILQSYIQKHELQAMIIQSPVNLHYFAGFTGTTGVALVFQTVAYFITDSRYTEQAQHQCEGYEVIQYSKPLWETVNDLLVQHQVTSGLIGIEGDSMCVDTYETICDTVSKGLQFKSVKLQQLRAIKRPDELDIMRHVARIADESFAALLPQLHVGMTENEARIILETEMLRRGSEGPSFDTIIASGVRSSMPHGVASDKVIEDGDFVTIDFGAIYKGYHSDMTRTFVMGHASDLQRRLYNVVLTAQELGVQAVRPGLSGKKLDAICRNSITEAGYGEYFQHGLGHGVGLDIHELPKASPTSECVLAENMVVTVEPGVYLPDHIGLRIEDSVIVTANGCEIITHTPKTLMELGI